VQVEPVQAEPVQTAPVPVEPVQAEPRQTAPVQVEPVQAEPRQVTSVQEEPVQAEPVQTAPVQVEPAKEEPAQAEPLLEEPAQAAPVQDEPKQEFPEQKEAFFLDVKADDWFYGDVNYVFENGFMTGNDKNMFNPGETLTWAAFLTVLYRFDGSSDVTGLDSTFDKVYGNAWYKDAVKWAAAKGIGSGFEDGVFNPVDILVTREQMAAAILRYMTHAGIVLPVDLEYRYFADENQISDYAKGAIQTLNKLDIIRGNANGMINPKGSATRAEFAAMLHRFTELTK